RLRLRNGSFELKIGKGRGAAQEIITEKEIGQYLKINSSIQEFMGQSLKVFMEFKTNRKEYKKNGFIIDYDETDFGCKVYEIEKIVENEKDIPEAKKKIKEFVLSHGIEIRKALGKRKEYLKKFKPVLYQ